jgi:hypothetical protein
LRALFVRLRRGVADLPDSFGRRTLDRASSFGRCRLRLVGQIARGVDRAGEATVHLIANPYIVHSRPCRLSRMARRHHDVNGTAQRTLRTSIATPGPTATLMASRRQSLAEQQKTA